MTTFIRKHVLCQDTDDPHNLWRYWLATSKDADGKYYIHAQPGDLRCLQRFDTEQEALQWVELMHASQTPIRII